MFLDLPEEAEQLLWVHFLVVVAVLVGSFTFELNWNQTSSAGSTRHFAKSLGDGVGLYGNQDGCIVQVSPLGFGQLSDDLISNQWGHHGSLDVSQHQVLLPQLLISFLQLETVHDRARGQSLLGSQVQQTGLAEVSLSALTVVVTVLVCCWK